MFVPCVPVRPSLNSSLQVTSVSSKLLNLLDKDAVQSFFRGHGFFDLEYICAVGGSRLQDDDASVFFDNVRMLDNVLQENMHFEHLIYFSSGAGEQSQGFGFRQRSSQSHRFRKGFTLWNKLSYAVHGQVDRPRSEKTSLLESLTWYSFRIDSPDFSTKRFVDLVGKHVPREKVVIVWGTAIPVLSKSSTSFQK